MVIMHLVWAKCTSPTQSWSIYGKWACLCWFPDQLVHSELRPRIYLSIGYFKWTALNAGALLSRLVLPACPGTHSPRLADVDAGVRQPLDNFIPRAVRPPASRSPGHSDWHGSAPLHPPSIPSPPQGSFFFFFCCSIFCSYKQLFRAVLCRPTGE